MVIKAEGLVRAEAASAAAGIAIAGRAAAPATRARRFKGVDMLISPDWCECTEPGRQADPFFDRSRVGHGAPLSGALCQVPARRLQRRVGALMMRRSCAKASRTYFDFVSRRHAGCLSGLLVRQAELL